MYTCDILTCLLVCLPESSQSGYLCECSYSLHINMHNQNESASSSKQISVCSHNFNKKIVFFSEILKMIKK